MENALILLVGIDWVSGKKPAISGHVVRSAIAGNL